MYDGTHNVRSAWNTNEDGLDEFTRKYVGGDVSKEFVDNSDGTSVLHKYIGEGEVTLFTQYMIHVSYLSDSDSEDMEEYEIKHYWVGRD